MHTPQSGHGEEDRGHGSERQLEAWLEQRARCPREQHDCSECHRVPAVARTRKEPCHRSEAARDSGPNDRRLPANGQRIRQDGDDRGDVPDDPRQSDDIE